MKLQVVFARSFSWLTPNQTKLYPTKLKLTQKKPNQTQTAQINPNKLKKATQTNPNKPK